VTDHNAELMKQLIPTYSLPKSEHSRIIEDMASSCKYESISPLMQSVMEESHEMMAEMAETEAILESQETTADKDVLHLINTFDSPEMPEMPKQLPKPIEIIVNTLPDKTKGYGAMAIFPMLGLYLKNVKFDHIRDGAVEPAFMSMVVGVSSSGKNDIKRIKKFILEPIERYTQESEIILREYEKEVRKCGKNAPLPERPENLRLQIVENDMTKAGKLKYMQQSAPYRLFVFCAELEGLYMMNDGKAKEFWNDVCKGYDCEDIGQVRASAEAVSGRTLFRMNWIAQSTGKRFVDAIEKAGSITQGALSRLNVILLPEDEEDYGEFTTIADIDYNDGVLLRGLISKLEEHEDCTLSCPEARVWHRKQFEHHLNYAKAMKFKAYQNIFKRALTSGFWRAMVLWVMNDRKWTKEIEDFASWTVEYDVWSKLTLFGDKIKSEFKKEREVLCGKTNFSILYNQLPQSFSSTDLFTLRKSLGLNQELGDEKIKSLNKNLLVKWTKRGKIIKNGDGNYNKI
jgi:hypothetical protein